MPRSASVPPARVRLRWHVRAKPAAALPSLHADLPQAAFGAVAVTRWLASSLHGHLLNSSVSSLGNASDRASRSA
ncbi:MAG: hypothetical protein ACRD1G_04785, partial [Acidimicrobiales bacterium]